MENITNYLIRNSNQFHSYFDVIKVLMENAEKMSADGEEKLNLVLSSWEILQKSPCFTAVLGPVNMETVKIVIETTIFVTKSTVAVNKLTGCWTAFRAIFKR